MDSIITLSRQKVKIKLHHEKVKKGTGGADEYDVVFAFKVMHGPRLVPCFQHRIMDSVIALAIYAVHFPFKKKKMPSDLQFALDCMLLE
jgi:hypothetical protein